MIIKHQRCYKASRRDAYPDIGDQLDAAFKLAQYLQDIGHALPSEVQDWISQCSAVKDSHPKTN